MRSVISMVPRVIEGIVLAGLFGIYVSIYYPGYMTPDTIYMLKMAMGMEPTTNWHSPLLVYLWRLLYQIFQQIPPIWLTQLTVFFASVVLVSQTYRNKWVGRLAALVLLTWPAIVTNLGVLWKDCWTVIIALVSVAFLKQALNCGSRRAAWWSFACAVVVTFLRIDYAIIMLPAILALGGRPMPAGGAPGWRVAGMIRMSAAFVVAAALGQWASNALVEVRLHPWIPTARWDVLGTQVEEGGSDVVIGHVAISAALARRLYNCSSSDFIAFHTDLWPNALRVTEEEASILWSSWWHTVLQHPRAYLRHRACVFSNYLGWQPDASRRVYAWGIDDNPFGMQLKRTEVNIAVYAFFDSISHGWIWHYWIYILVGVVLWVASSWYRGIRPVETVLLAMVIAAACRGIVVPVAVFRYGIWIVFATILLVFEVADVLSDGRRAVIGRCSRPV